MPLYMCSECGCIENTATGGYWTQQAKANYKSDFKPLCSEHNPAIGAWHGEFPQMKAEGYVQSKEGFIYSASEAGDRFRHLGPFRPVKMPKGLPDGK